MLFYSEDSCSSKCCVKLSLFSRSKILLYRDFNSSSIIELDGSYFFMLISVFYSICCFLDPSCIKLCGLIFFSDIYETTSSTSAPNISTAIEKFYDDPISSDRSAIRF